MGDGAVRVLGAELLLGVLHLDGGLAADGLRALADDLADLAHGGELLGVLQLLIAVLAADAAAGLFAGLLGVAVARALALLILGVLRLLAGLAVLPVGLLLAALLLLAVLGLLLFGALLSLALLPLLLARFLLAGLALLRLHLGEDVLDRVLHLAEQAIVVRVAGVLLGIPLLAVLVALLAGVGIVVAAVGLRGVALLVAVGLLAGVGRFLAVRALRFGLAERALGGFLADFVHALHRLAGALEALLGGGHFAVGRELRLGELVLFVGGLLDRVGAEGLVQHRRERLLEVEAMADAVAKAEEAAGDEQQRGHRVCGARHPIWRGQPDVGRSRDRLGGGRLRGYDAGSRLRGMGGFAEIEGGRKRVGEAEAAVDGLGRGVGRRSAAARE